MVDFNNYHFDLDTGKFTFPDGVEYSLREALFISRTASTMEDVRAVHSVKTIFDGIVLDGSEKEDIQPRQSPLDKYLIQAREMVRAGKRFNTKKKGVTKSGKEKQTQLFDNS